MENIKQEIIKWAKEHKKPLCAFGFVLIVGIIGIIVKLIIN